MVYPAVRRDAPGILHAIKFPNNAELAEELRRAARTALYIRNATYLARPLEVLAPLEEPGWPPFGVVMLLYPASLRHLSAPLSSPPRQVPREVAMRWLREVLSALAELERHQFVHRDIHDGNIWFQSDSTVAVFDRAYLPHYLQAEAVVGDLGTLGKDESFSNLVVFRRNDDPWKDDRLYPPDPGTPEQRRSSPPQRCRRGMDIYAFRELVLRIEQLSE